MIYLVSTLKATVEWNLGTL